VEISGDARVRGIGVEHYFFDLHFGDEQVVDEDGVDHFDEGSAVYYGQRIADRIGRDADYRSLKVHVRSLDGSVLAIVAASSGRGREQVALIGR
jgi:hypothetical protein